jgi:predicted lipoprotein with Yx(FWY)xxD motif
MRRTLLITVLAVLAVFVGVGLGSAQAIAKGSKLKLEQNAEYGQILVNGKGKALYLFTKESGPESACYGDCATAWPPYLTSGKPVAGKGLKAKWIATTPRDDGTRQVSYRGHPLYFYEHDTPSLILCQDVFEFGGLWLLVNGRGNAVR